MPRRRPRLPRAALPALVGVGSFALTASLLDFAGGDRLVHFEQLGRNILDGLIPYRDYVLEYPPAAIPALLIPAPGGAGYETRFRIFMFALAAVSIVLIVALRSRVDGGRLSLYAIALFLGVSPEILGRTPFFNGFDWWPSMLTLVAVTVLLCGYRRTAAGVIGLAAAAKVYPMILFPLMLLFRRGQISWRSVRDEVAAFAGVIVLVNLPFAVLAPHGLASSYWRIARRPLQIESLGGSMLLAAHQLGLYRARPYYSFAGSWDLAGRLPDVLAPLSAVVLGIAVIAVWIVFAQGPRGAEPFLTAVAASVAAFVAFNKVFSPEYNVWLVALVPLAGRAVRLSALALLTGSLLLTHAYYPSHYLQATHLSAAGWFVFGRNVTVVVLYLVLLAGLRSLATATATVATGTAEPRLSGATAP